MCDGFRRVGQHQDPAPVRLDDAHTVGGVDFAATGGFQHGAHHRALCCPRRGQRAAEYGGPRCQSLVAAYPDRLVEALVLKAVEPAALELSPRAAERAERDRGRLHALWEQRLGRA